jgi:predicted nucleic acid-binding protein
MRIVIDTNVVISGIFFGGNPRKILEAVVNGEYVACVIKTNRW